MDLVMRTFVATGCDRMRCRFQFDPIHKIEAQLVLRQEEEAEEDDDEGYAPAPGPGPGSRPATENGQISMLVIIAVCMHALCLSSMQSDGGGAERTPVKVGA